MSQQTPRNEYVRAVKAVKALLDDPDDLPKVFTVVESLPGRSQVRLRKQFEASEAGREMLAREPQIVPLLSDRDALRAMPEGSLAHAYLAFVESENISAQGLVEAAAAGKKGGRDTWPDARMQDTHDLFHAATGYQGDVLGELALLAFNLGQNWHPGIALIVGAALARGISQDNTWLIVEGFVRGKRAAFLGSLQWEAWLALPLTEVRARLRLGGPVAYQPVRTAELRAKGKVPTLRAA